MKKRTAGRAAGRQPMVDKQRDYARLIRRGVSNSEACRRLGIDRRTGHWWKNGGRVTRNGVTRIVEHLRGEPASVITSHRDGCDPLGRLRCGGGSCSGGRRGVLWPQPRRR
jgi:hypothetical protein